MAGNAIDAANEGFTVTLVLGNVNGTFKKSDKDFSWMEFQGGVLVKKR